MHVWCFPRGEKSPGTSIAPSNGRNGHATNCRTPQIRVYSALSSGPCGKLGKAPIPVHADKVDRAVAESVAEKHGELGAVHLPRSHRERAMMDRAEPLA